MINKERNNQVAFEGKGNIFITYHKLTEKLSQLQRMLLEAEVNGNYKTTLEELRAKAVEKGLINDHGDLICFPPKRALITDGEGEFDETVLKNSDFVFQKGGEIEKPIEVKRFKYTGGVFNQVNAKNAFVKGQPNGVIVAEESFKAKNAETTNFVLLAKKVKYIDSKAAGKLTLIKDFESFGKTEINGASFDSGTAHNNTKIIKTDVREVLTLMDSSRVEGSSVGGKVVANGKSSVADSVLHSTFNINESAEASNLDIWGKTTIKGQNHKIDKLTVHNALVAEGTETEISNTYANTVEGKGSVKFRNLGAFKGELSEQAEVDGLEVGNLKLKDSAKVGGEKVNVDFSADLYNESSLENGTVGNFLELYDNASAKNVVVKEGNVTTKEWNYPGQVKLENVKAPEFYLYGNVQVRGTLEGKIIEMSSKVKFKGDFKLDDAARKSLPWYRVRAKYFPSHRMKV